MSDPRSNTNAGAEHARTDQRRKTNVVAAMMIAVLIGAVLGGLVGVLVLPDVAAATALGGAMLAGAIRVFSFMSHAGHETPTHRSAPEDKQS